MGEMLGAARKAVRALALTGLLCLAAIVPGAAEAAGPAGKVVFTSDRNGDLNNFNAFTMNQDGSGATQLTFFGGTTQVLDPTWAPDARQILASYWPVGADGEVVIMNPDGSGFRQLTDNAAPNDWGPSVSPDGTRIAFTSDRGTGQVSNDIWVMNIDGSNPVQLTSNHPVDDFGPDWSPDGTKIAFLSESPGAPFDPDLWVMNADGSGQTALNANDVNDTSPHFSPDGKLLAFASILDGDNEVYVMPSGGGAATNLTNTGGGTAGNDRGPEWSKDGLARIFFISRRVGNDDEIFVMNGDGSGVSGALTSTAGNRRSLSPEPQPAVSCGGKLATIIGTGASETLTGGPGPDIISGQGGKDQISGLAGKDIACGDAGKDTLKGGKGKDVLNGGKANDKLVGGKGKDTCIGGKGKKDTGKSCEKEKKIP
jgi:Tol biopolymer transport system component